MIHDIPPSLEMLSALLCVHVLGSSHSLFISYMCLRNKTSRMRSMVLRGCRQYVCEVGVCQRGDGH